MILFHCHPLYSTATSLLALLFCFSLLSFFVSQQLWITAKITCFLDPTFQRFINPLCSTFALFTPSPNSQLTFLSILLQLQELKLKKMKQVSAFNFHMGYAQVVIPQYFISWFLFVPCANNNKLATHSPYLLLSQCCSSVIWFLKICTWKIFNKNSRLISDHNWVGWY